MKRILVGVAYGLVGLVVAVGLTFGAYAIARQDLSQPAEPNGAGGALYPAVASAHPSPEAGETDHPTPQGGHHGGASPTQRVTPPPHPTTVVASSPPGGGESDNSGEHEGGGGDD